MVCNMFVFSIEHGASDPVTFDPRTVENIFLNIKVFWYPKLICTANSRAFKTKHFDINLMQFGGLIRKLWIIKYEIWTAAILFSS